MLIDDEPIVNFLNTTILNLEWAGCEVVSATGVDQAMEVCSTQHEKEFDLIFLDINMPDKDGWHFVSEYQELTKATDPSIIVLSSSIDPEDHKKAESYSYVRQFISKPLTQQTIEQVLS